MTRDEQRTACIKAMTTAYVEAFYGYIAPLVTLNPGIQRSMAAAFDTLHGIARVVPLEATERMKDSLDERWFDVRAEDINEVFDIMSAAGDLTNPPDSA